MNRADAIARYTEVAHRFPTPRNPANTHYVDNLEQLADEFDAFVLDGYGVLNLGAAAIPGACKRVEALKSAGKSVLVLTNGATLPVELAMQKYLDWGMPFTREQVVSSRNALEEALAEYDSGMHWGVAATAFAQIDKLAPNTCLLEDDSSVYEQVDGFILLSSLDWTDSRQTVLRNALQRKRRPLLVGNPDLVAPHEHAMSLEPGLFAHALADEDLCDPQFYGKPFHSVFDIVSRRLSGIPGERIAMVGDTLHTDILGGSSYGWRSVLIKNHGLMREADDELVFNATGIRPHFVAATT